MEEYKVGYIDPIEFHTVIKKIRKFFDDKGFIEIHAQSRFAITSGCEDPQTISVFHYANQSWPLPQTNQNWLEYELLKKPSYEGLYTVTTSYRNEPIHDDGRHDLCFPLVDFELKGGFDKLIELEKELCEQLGYGDRKNYAEGDYLDVAKKYGVDVLTSDHEELLGKEYGPVYFLKNFISEEAYWNMKREGNISKKCDVLLSSCESIGSAERSCNPEEMLQDFHTVSNGEYAKKLFNLFGKDRVMNEVNSYLKLPMIQRSGGGIGVTRVIRSMRKENLL